MPSPSNLLIFVPSSSGDCVSVAPTANRRREAPPHAGPHGAGLAGRVPCARCNCPATLRHRVAELRHHCSRAPPNGGNYSGDLDEVKEGAKGKTEEPEASVHKVRKQP